MPGENIWAALGMLFAVAVILVLAWVTTRAIASKGVPGFPRGGGRENFQILGQVSLGRSERLVLFRAGERCLLLGVTANSVTLLLELSGEEAQQWLTASQARQAGGISDFLEVFQKNLHDRK